MATLHIVSRSPWAASDLQSALRFIGTDDALLLCGDAVYALTDTDCRTALHKHTNSTFALDEDLLARQITATDNCLVVDYAAMVDLSIRFDRVNNWL